MTQVLDCDEYVRWIKQADYTLLAMDTDMNAGNYSWVCFKAQQAAELSVRALLKALGKPAFGHNLVALFNDLSGYCSNVSSRLRFCIGYLDKMYVTPRYPDALTEGIPYERYTREEAEEASNCARLVVDWVKGCSPCH
ncbi:MAG: HEPN domain-containing protein [Caldivirga sp.]|uniref:HEPN domain-containing protein n=1 Tax=Caldivirga sp. TaxID=2080243 RepID=UPI003D0AE8F4